MKKLGLTIGLICAACCLPYFAVNEAFASDAIPAEKSTQTRPGSKKVKLAELMQRLEDANPWAVEKVSEALGGVDLTLAYSNQYILSYTTNNIIYENGLLIRKIELRLKAETKQMTKLILDLNNNTKCFTLDDLRKMYPSIHDEPPSYVPSIVYYVVKRSWGRILFGFERERPDCLGDIAFVTPKRKE